MRLLPLSNHYFDEGRTIVSCPSCNGDLVEEAHSTLLDVNSDKDEGQFVSNVPTTRVCAKCLLVVFDKEKLAEAASMCLLKGKSKNVTYSVVGLVDHSTKSASEVDQSVVTTKPSLPRVVGQKTGRNEPCLCGSGKKYKKCCLRKKEN